MIILKQKERKAHIDLIRHSTDSPVAMPPGKRFLIYHVPDHTVKSKSGIYLPPAVEEETKLRYKSFPPGIGLVIAISGEPRVSEQYVNKLKEQAEPGMYASDGRIDNIEVGDYVRFDTSGAYQFTDQHNGTKLLLVYLTDLLSVITVTRIEADEAENYGGPWNGKNVAAEQSAEDSDNDDDWPYNMISEEERDAEEDRYREVPEKPASNADEPKQ